MAATRYENLRDKVLRKYHLSTTDIDAMTMEALFNDVLDEYSRFRGIRTQKKYTFDTGAAEKVIDSEIHHIITVLWNDTYPSDDLLTEEYASEDYHFPSLRVIKDMKAAIERALSIETEQEFQVSHDGDDKKLILDPAPTTDVFVLYRKLFTKETYPFQDERLLQKGYEAAVLQYCQSTGIVVQVGDLRFDQKRMDDKIAGLNREFHLTLCPYAGAKS
jgi:hypothetical protein